MTARILNCTEAEYRADNFYRHDWDCVQASLNQSIAYILATQSPAHAYAAHPHLGGGVEDDPTPEMLEGSALHRLILGRGSDIACSDTFLDWRSKDARAFKENALAEGKIPLTLTKGMLVKDAAANIIPQLANLGIVFGDMRTEVAISFEDAGVLCRAKLDATDGNTVYELKSVRSANPEAIARAIFTNGYDIQQEAYRRAWAAVRGIEPEEINVEFVFVEREAPFAVTVAPLAGTFRAVGVERWERAREIWRRCLAYGKWPGYGRIQPIAAPPWVLSQSQEALAASEVNEEA